ncbi:MAG: phage holin family protein [Eubacteriales bacterium]
MRYVIKFVLYLCALYVFMSLGLLQEATLNTLLIAAAVLALVNTIIRPIFSLMALPLTIVTFGIASIFVNMLTISIASGITGGTLACSFWVKLLVAIVIMFIDNGIRYTRNVNRKKIDVVC